MENKSFVYAGITIEYALHRKPVKNINIRIQPSGEISVSAPTQVSQAELTAFLESKAEWIIRHLAEVEQKKAAAPDQELYTGKTLYLLGKAFPLEVVPGDKGRVALYENHVAIFSPDRTQNALREIYLKWLRTLAMEAYPDILDTLYPLVAPYGVEKPVLQVKNMRTRWGSCNRQAGRIWLNLQLIKTPRTCIEEVLLHELVHLVHGDHSKAFYDLLTELMPDWRERQADLEAHYKDGIL